MIAFRGITHGAIAVAIYSFLDNIIDFGIPVGSAVLCLLFGSLIPDIDHPRSTFGKYIIPISAVVKHRNGYTHSFLGVFIFTLPVLLLGIEYYLFSIWAYLFHLLADTLTSMGVQWFFPFLKKKYSLDFMRTGGPEEAIIVIMCLIFIFSI